MCIFAVRARGGARGGWWRVAASCGYIRAQYGGTGSGKTFTMEGECGSSEQRGLVPRAIEHIFGAVQGAR